jgi:hypothetical protein
VSLKPASPADLPAKGGNGGSVRMQVRPTLDALLAIAAAIVRLS